MYSSPVYLFDVFLLCVYPSCSPSLSVLHFQSSFFRRPLLVSPCSIYPLSVPPLSILPFSVPSLSISPLPVPPRSVLTFLSFSPFLSLLPYSYLLLTPYFPFLSLFLYPSLFTTPNLSLFLCSFVNITPFLSFSFCLSLSAPPSLSTYPISVPSCLSFRKCYSIVCLSMYISPCMYLRVFPEYPSV